MHEVQKEILDIAKRYDLGKLTLREIGELVTGSNKGLHPQIIKHHLNQLIKKGLLYMDKVKNKVNVVSGGKKRSGFVSIPIVGCANCGPATMVAEENIEGFLKVSSSFLNKTKNICAIKAVGNSMNRASVGRNKLAIDDGDYVIIDYKDRNPENNDYILSVIDGMANIKKFIKDNANRQVVLLSESTQDYPPIFIDKQDLNCYFINGKIIQVIKTPKGTKL